MKATLYLHIDVTFDISTSSAILNSARKYNDINNDINRRSIV